jgi:hypothetical protein
MTGFHWNVSTTMPIKSFRDSIRSPVYRRHILMENMSFGGFSAGPHCKEHPVAVGRILDSSKFAAIFVGLEPAELCYLACFGVESPDDVSC